MNYILLRHKIPSNFFRLEPGWIDLDEGVWAVRRPQAYGKKVATHLEKVNKGNEVDAVKMSGAGHSIQDTNILVEILGEHTEDGLVSICHLVFAFVHPINSGMLQRMLGHIPIFVFW